MIIRILFLFTYLLFSAQLFAQVIRYNTVDFSGMAPFWQVESSLIKDTEPDPDEWNALFDAPPYQILMAGGFSQKEFEQQLRLAFMPSMGSLLRKELDKNNPKSNFLRHVMQIMGNEKKLKELQANLQKAQLIKTALSMAKELLPDSFLYARALPPVSFIICDKAISHAPTGVIIDLLFSMDFEAYVPYFIAHEAYHFYRAKIKVPNLPGHNQPEYPIIQMLTQMETEGIADQIDKKKFFLNRGPFAGYEWARSYQHYLAKSPQAILQLDEYFIRMATVPNSDSKIIEDLLPMNGHPTGYYMANAIIEKMGKRTLIQQTANPFAFIRLYQRVALKDKKHYPPFSSITMQYLRKLEQKYYLPKKAEQPKQKSSPKLMWYEKDKVINNW
ncbi:DUF5700 domain-containing putative Zn-dependent protease [Prolixibacter sp. SD074]|uniref:DUF5700 domain-containing putative Zn-dependent protease n=1 Tax=Prolixibacter sp. SD074 TaxID=2652391 RepID=UPI001274404F|nr:DUF5700 domain-containing putative Zn-dependent protease [Prolixibacter sp. SD074]GET28323.1 hypothetical protein SD074_05250 [Prolixibacter sp. SD074]